MALHFRFETFEQARAFEEAVELKTACHSWYEYEEGQHVIYVQHAEGEEDRLQRYYDNVLATGEAFNYGGDGE